MSCNYEIPILPVEAKGEWLINEIALRETITPLSMLGEGTVFWGPSGRWLISAILANEGLVRQDEVAILTTSDQTYVSTCLSVTAFNFCKISRIVSPATKLVIVVHEFGYVAEGIASKISKWQKQGKIVVEDCAHVLGLTVPGGVVGHMGDYAVYSFPKLFPVRSGGLIVARRHFDLPEMTEELHQKAFLGREAANNFLGHFRYFNELRRIRAELIMTSVPIEMVFSPSSVSIPFFQGLVVDRKDKVLAEVEGIEWGATLRDDLLYFPTNPFVELPIYEKLLAQLRVILGLEG